MYDMTRVAGKGYFDSADDAATRNEARTALAAARTRIAATVRITLRCSINKSQIFRSPGFKKTVL